MSFLYDYFLTVGLRNGGTITVRPPMRITFNIEQATTGGLNKANIQIYNLSDSTRAQIVKDPTDSVIMQVTLQAGYVGNIKQIFKGNITQARNARQGVDFITSIECLDGNEAALSSFTSAAVRGKNESIQQLVNDMHGVESGKITEQSPLTRAKIMFGNSWKLLRDSTDPQQEVFIHDQRVNILNRNEVLGSTIPIVSPATGLKTTPEKQQQQIVFTTLINPAIRLGEQVSLQSTTARYINGIYKVISISFTGDYEGESWEQKIKAIANPNSKVL